MLHGAKFLDRATEGLADLRADRRQPFVQESRMDEERATRTSADREPLETRPPIDHGRGLPAEGTRPWCRRLRAHDRSSGPPLDGLVQPAGGPSGGGPSAVDAVDRPQPQRLASTGNVNDVSVLTHHTGLRPNGLRAERANEVRNRTQPPNPKGQRFQLRRNVWLKVPTRTSRSGHSPSETLYGTASLCLRLLESAGTSCLGGPDPVRSLAENGHQHGRSP